MPGSGLGWIRRAASLELWDEGPMPRPLAKKSIDGIDFAWQSATHGIELGCRASAGHPDVDGTFGRVSTSVGAHHDL